MTVIFEQTGTSFVGSATDVMGGQGFDTQPQSDQILATNLGPDAASVYYTFYDDSTYPVWPAVDVPGFGTIVQPGTQQVLKANATRVADGATGMAFWICDSGKTATLVFNIGTV